MAKLTTLSLIATSRGRLYPIVAPQSYPPINIGTVEQRDKYFVTEEERETIVQNILREFEVK